MEDQKYTDDDSTHRMFLDEDKTLLLLLIEKIFIISALDNIAKVL